MTANFIVDCVVGRHVYLHAHMCLHMYANVSHPVFHLVLIQIIYFFFPIDPRKSRCFITNSLWGFNFC